MGPPGAGVDGTGTALTRHGLGLCPAGLPAPVPAWPICLSLSAARQASDSTQCHTGFRAPFPPAHLGMGSVQHGQTIVLAPGALLQLESKAGQKGHEVGEGRK